MPELLCHLLGDYVFQNHWMATKKTRSLAVACLHALVYSCVFLVLSPSYPAFGCIFATHAVIDRFRLANYWTSFWGVGCPGYLYSWRRKSAAPFDTAPPYVSTWLLIIVDNTLHLLINHVSLRFL